MKKILFCIASIKLCFNFNTMAGFLRLTPIASCFFFAMTCTATVLVIPDATITGLTHTDGHYSPAGPTSLITDSVNSGQFGLPGFTTLITGSETVDWSIEAPAGEMFAIQSPPAGFPNIGLSMFCQWWGAGSDGIGNPSSTSFTFENLVGTAPVQTSVSDILGTGGRFVQFSESFSVAPGTTFTGIELSAQYDFDTGNPTTLQFNPQSFAFDASTVSSQDLSSDGILMTIQSVPEPKSFTLFVCLLTAPAVSGLVRIMRIKKSL